MHTNRMKRLYIALIALVLAGCTTIKEQTANNYYVEGIKYYTDSDWDKARECFHKCLELDSTHKKAKYKLADAYYYQGIDTYAKGDTINALISCKYCML